MDVFRMKCFISVARHQNMTAAAREMFITRPAMTAQMNALEKETGCRLLIRDRKKIQLTPAGRQALATFEDVVAQLDELDVEMRRIATNVSGSLRLGFHGPVEWMHLYDLWREFHENNPDVDSTVVFNPWNLLVKGVEAGEVDAAFVELSEIDGLTHLASRALFDDCSCVVVRRDHPFAEQDVVTTDQLRGQRLLLPDASISPRYFRSFREQLGNAGLEVREMGQGNYFEATLAMAAAGSGVAIMPRSYRMVSDVVRFVDLDAPEIPIHMGLVWRKQNDNPALPAFVDAAAAWDWTM